ncbi:MAG: AMIN domain-containing protein [Gemmatimonadetes bacterium]|nr:AMIN domain-containing protein [Gemmatimonadota bacterium]MBL0179344.1 AMIN domain-containing protein [Gemmatimonadota bacterium]
MMTRSLSWLLLPALVAAAPASLRPLPDAAVTALALSSGGGTARLAITVSGTVTVKESTLPDPARLVLDIQGAKVSDLGRYDGLKRGRVVDVRVNQYATDIVRIVLELDRLPSYSVNRETPGVVTVTFADEPFATWNAGLGGAKSATVVSEALADAAAPVAATRAPTRERPAAASYSQSGDRYASGLTISPQAGQQGQDMRPISVTYDKTPIGDVLNQFAVFSGRSIVPGKGVVGDVTMSIINQPWPYAFEAVLAQQGLSAMEMRGGIIRVDAPAELAKLDAVEVLDTRQKRLNYARAGDVVNSLKAMMLKDRGSVVADSASNSLIITDTRTRMPGILEFVDQLDIRTPLVAIQAKLIYVDRTDLQQLGLKYDIGTADQFFNKLVSRPDPLTGQPYNPNVNVVNLGGSAVSAISNADALISGSALDLVFSTAIGGFSVTSFLSALERVELTDVEASPLVHTLDNNEATIWSGEETPVRVIDASSFGQVNQAPRANVTFKETGIKLIVRPHVTANRQISMEIKAERSSIQPLAAADLGFTIPKQYAETRTLVNDGETAMLGGLTITTVTRNRNGIPLLSGLPFIGNLFSFTENRENRKDLIILVMPRIVDDAQNIVP